MKWIPAKERLPEILLGESKTFYCRHVRDGRKRVYFYGKSGRSYLSNEPHNWEWLDESFPTDYNMGFKDALEMAKLSLSLIKSTKP